MSKNLRYWFLLSWAGLAACGDAGTPPPPAAVRTSDAPPRTGSVRGIVFARPFVLAEPYVHRWRHEQPLVNAGWLLVLDVDPSTVVPRQSAMPVLILGEQTVEAVNFGQDSGRMIAIVPSPADEHGLPSLDPSANDAWFGPPELPERVDAAWIAGARGRSRPEELVRFTATEVEAARARGGALLRAADRVEIDREAARLILKYSPRERELAEGLLVPVTR